MATYSFDTTDLTIMVRLTEAAAASRSLASFRLLGEGAGAKLTGLPDLDAAIIASGPTHIWRICHPISRRGRGSTALMGALRELLARTLVLIAADAITYRKLRSSLRSVRSLEHVEKAEARAAAATLTPQSSARGPIDGLLKDQWGLTAMGWTELTTTVKSSTAAFEIGIIDTNVVPSEPDLPNSKLFPSEICMEEEEESSSSSHGTGVASIAAAAMKLGSLGTTDESAGMVGVHPNAKLRAAVVLSSGTDRASSAEITRALTHLADGETSPLSGPPRAKVINLSIAGPASSDTERCAMYYALARGALVVAASGNRAQALPDYPARYESESTLGLVHWTELFKKITVQSWREELKTLSEALLVVGAIEKSGSAYCRWSDSASTGSNAVGDRGLVAPGREIITRDASGSPSLGTGTSYAAPHVAGAASLLLAYRHSKNLPVMTNLSLAKSLRDSASTSKVASGDDADWYGHGLINVKRLIDATE